MKVRWSPGAAFDRDRVFAFISSNDRRAAQRIDALFSAAVARLETYPSIGREGDVPDTRELVPHPSYRIVYKIFDDAVLILALVHTARQWPPDNP